MLGRSGAELGEDAAPGGDLGEIRYRGSFQPFGGGSLFGAVLLEQLLWTGSVGQPTRVDDSGADRRVPLDDCSIVGERGDESPLSQVVQGVLAGSWCLGGVVVGSRGSLELTDP